MNVSVVIPVRNMAATLERAIRSASDADEIIVVDDASSDNSLEIAQAALDWYDDLLVIRANESAPVGVCAARNIAIDAAAYDLIVPLDADDQFIEGGLKALVEAYEPGTFVYGGWRELTATSQETRQAPPPGMLGHKNLCQATWLFAREDWRRVGGYPVRYSFGAEDYALMCALVAAGVKAKRIDATVYNYYKNPNGRALWCSQHWDFIRALLREDYPSVVR